MARSGLLLDLVRAGARGDRALFRKSLEALVTEERAKQHHVLADRLAAHLQPDGARPGGGTPPAPRSNGPVAALYHETARGFGVRDYRALVRTGKANETRLRTASEFARRELGGSAFGAGLVRRALYAVWRTAEDRGDAADGLRWLRAELPDYWPRRAALAAVLRYLAARRADHWREDAAAARVLAGAVENDHV